MVVTYLKQVCTKKNNKTIKKAYVPKKQYTNCQFYYKRPSREQDLCPSIRVTAGGHYTDCTFHDVVSCSFYHERLPNFKNCTFKKGIITSIHNLRTFECLLQQPKHVIESIVEIEIFDYSGCDLPNNIDAFVNLQHLEITSCDYITTIPEALCRLEKLAVLHIQGNKKLLNLPTNIGNLTSLRKFFFSESPEITKLPTSITKLKLDQAKISEHNLTEIPQNIADVMR